MKSPVHHSNNHDRNCAPKRRQWFCIGLTCICPPLVRAASAPPLLVEREQIVESSLPPNKQWVAAEQGKQLTVREIVAARENSRATIQLTESRQLRVRSNSQVRILPSLVAGSPLGLDLQKGEIYLHSREPGDGMQINTPPGNAKTHGTQFLVRVADDGTATFTVFEGSVEMSNAHGNLTLHAHEEGEMKHGQAPRPTSRIVTKNLLQWCMYYPGVLHPAELSLSPSETKRLSVSIAHYNSGNLPQAVSTWPAGYEPQSDASRAFLAMLRLTIGEVEQARRILAESSSNHPSQLALEELIGAVNFNHRDTSREPTTADGWLARSYYEQSRTENPDSLKRALAAARKSWEMRPDFGFAAVRVAELEFSFGHGKQALEVLRKGIELTPYNAQGRALMGFILTDRNCMAAARESFQQAIDIDGALGNAWLGRGLCSIRTGNLEEGKRDLQTAVVLEPNRSLFHSYLGKANTQAGLPEEASRDLRYAIDVDPNDPTPWLYSALLDLDRNRLNSAIADLNHSVELNDNRRLYRSSLLLDQDKAVRKANLARIYQSANMRDVAIREATRAVESDYTNPSAHLFLANSFDDLRDPRRVQLRYETPWFNELLISNLLSPVGGGPLSQYVSNDEYSRLMESDGIGGILNSEFRTNSEIQSEASLFRSKGPVGFGFDYSYFESDGDRPNSDIRITELYGQIKWQPGPDDIVYFLGKWQEESSGDTFTTYDNAPLSENFRFTEDQHPGQALFGWNHRWNPGSNTLILGGLLSARQEISDKDSPQYLIQRDTNGLAPSFLHFVPLDGWVFTNPNLDNAVGVKPNGSLFTKPRFQKEFSRYFGLGKPIGLKQAEFDVDYTRDIDVLTAEIQHIETLDQHTLIMGGRIQNGNMTSTSVMRASGSFTDGVIANPAVKEQVDSEFHRFSIYGYDYWKPNKRLTAVAGLSWDQLDHPLNFRNPPVDASTVSDEQLSAKAGITLQPLDRVFVRAAYAQGLGGVTFDESVRLEPSQVAGFNQAYRTILSESVEGSVEAPEFSIAGLEIDGILPSETWWAVSLTRLDQNVTRGMGIFTGYDMRNAVPGGPAYFPDQTTQSLDYTESSLALNVNQLIAEEYSIGIGYRFTRSSLDTQWPEFPDNGSIPPTSHRHASFHALDLRGMWNSPSGWYASVDATWYRQAVDNGRVEAFYGSGQGDEFPQFDALIGYRFLENHANVSFGVLNLTDQDHNLDPLNPIPEIARERTAFVRVNLSF